MKIVGVNMLAIPPKMAGTGVYIHNLLSSLIELDGDVKFLVFINSKLIDAFPKSPKIEYRSFAVRGLIHRVFIEQVMLPIMSRKCTVLHSISNVAPLLSICPVVTTIHDIYQLYYPKRFPLLKLLYLKLFVPLSVWKSREVISVSECTKQDIIKHYSFFANRSTIVTVPEASRYDIRLRVENADDFILFVGTLEPGKNLATLLRAYDLLPREIKNMYPLKIVGGKGWKNSEIKTVIDDLNLHNYIDFLGYISDDELKELYYRATCFVLPTLYEGFGLPVLEAMSQGCPVITSNVSSLPEVAGSAGVLVDPMDINELKDALLSVVSSTERMADLMEKGYSQASKFSWKRCAEETFKLYY